MTITFGTRPQEKLGIATGIHDLTDRYSSYVALNTLTKSVDMDNNAVQRHRDTILDCLRDPDISIRRRALELAFALINSNNVRVLIRELLLFLEVADNEFKANMTAKICSAADRYAPQRRWYVDTVLRVLKLVRASFTRFSLVQTT